ncbi:MAG: 5'-methylthioadenosine/adenosylhomocysteine nucleosidase [Salibacteraceae bacterium]
MIKNQVIGIMGAMPEEINGIVPLLSDVTKKTFGKRDYFTGFVNEKKFVVVFSRWGKVAAATTATTLIHEFGVNEILFTGVAGAIHSDLNIGDVVVGKRFIQHDLDGRPLMQKFEIPLLNETYLSSATERVDLAEKCVHQVLNDQRLHLLFTEKQLNTFNIHHPKVYQGDIASGDQFISSDVKRDQITKELPEVLCVEMEGASVAQVCFEYNIPLIVIRTISDVADAHSAIDFPSFIKEISSTYSVEFIKQIFNI